MKVTMSAPCLVGQVTTALGLLSELEIILCAERDFGSLQLNCSCLSWTLFHCVFLILAVSQSTANLHALLHPSHTQQMAERHYASH